MIASEEDIEQVRAICDLVEHLWSLDRRIRQVTDDDSQWKLIAARQKTVKFPEYLELTGPPSPNDYDDDGRLTTSRKAELLLIGLFNWRGLSIARPAFIRDMFDWTQPADWNYWYVATEELPNPLPLEKQVFCAPLRFYECRWLSEHLYEQTHGPLSASQRLLHLDYNVQNCHPSNLAAYGKRGRPMYCSLCGVRVVKQNSYRIKSDGIYQRYCTLCVKEIGDSAEGHVT